MGRLALLSVSDKTGIVAFARQLVGEFGFELIGSGGTAQTLKAAGIPVKKVSDHTGAPEILGGRVKTLHPRIYGGILARRDLDSDLVELAENQIEPFELIVVNLYPFEQTIAQTGVTVAEAIEQIDIGGPAMLRASAKNFAHVTVISNPDYYHEYLQELRGHQGEATLAFRQKMASLTFSSTASYDRAISSYFQSLSPDSAPANFTLEGRIHQLLRYGENPHQRATWYKVGTEASGWVSAEKVQGKELSYNNLVDLEAARRLIAEFASERPTAAILKHTNPCGVATAESLARAYNEAFQADSVSAFGGVVAFNQPLDLETARHLTKTFLECIVAPACDPEARKVLATKGNLRVLLLPDLLKGPVQTVKVIAGGFLTQDADAETDETSTWQVATERVPSNRDLEELNFAWNVCKHVKSNAIVVSNHATTLGIGAGQMNRVGAAAIALEQAGERARGGYLASDGFFPFEDSVRVAARAGITAVVQPGGSIRDRESIDAANESGIAMILTGKRHFLH